MVDNGLIRRVIILGAIGIVSILGILAYIIRQDQTARQQDWDQQVRVALLQVAKRLSEYNQSSLPSRDLIRRITPSYYVVNINDRIDANVLEFYLYQEFEHLGLIEDFEYAIYDCATDAMLYGDYCQLDDDEDKVERKQATLLPRYDEFIYYFGVRFPEQRLLWYGDSRLPYLMAAILALSLFLFGYSLYVILRQQRIGRAQRDFIGNVTHEFKTPLSSIQIASEAFLADDTVQSNPRLSRYAQIIRDQNEQLHEQVLRILDVTRMEHGGLELNKESVDIAGLTRELIDAYLLSHVQDTEIHYQGPESARLSADAFHLRNVLNNLIDNAIKYNTPPRRIDIEYHAGSSSQWVIRDDGMGMNGEQRQRATEKYYRASTGDVHNVKGFGLGLYYVAQVVAAHGWDMDIQSQPGQGTEITLSL